MSVVNSLYKGQLLRNSYCQMADGKESSSGPVPSPRAAKGSRRINNRPSLPLPYGPPDGPSEPPSNLAGVVAAWPALPDPIKAAVLALVEAASGKRGGGR